MGAFPPRQSKRCCVARPARCRRVSRVVGGGDLRPNHGGLCFRSKARKNTLQLYLNYTAITQNCLTIRVHQPTVLSLRARLGEPVLRLHAELARRTHADGPRRQGDGGVTRCCVTRCRYVSRLAIAVQHELQGARGANRACVYRYVELTESQLTESQLTEPQLTEPQLTESQLTEWHGESDGSCERARPRAEPCE